MRSRALSAVLLAFALAGAVGAERAVACSCARGSMDSRFDRSDGAIVARLVSVDDINNQRATFNYRVLRVYKARQRLERGQELAIEAASDEAACGLPRRTGRKYGLFLYRSRGEWAANLCSVVEAWRMRRAGEGYVADRAPRGATSGCGAA